MRTTSTTATALAVAGLASAKTFDATSKTNVVTYWGQGANQGSLVSYCQNPNIDIINIGFVNVFPDQGKGGWPGTNFGNQCGNETYTHQNTSTQLLSNCPDIGPDIVLCQQLFGTKILLSIGGASSNGYIVDNTSATNFANFLWGSFGPSLDAWTAIGGPRPFGDAVVDGFDFDIESELSQPPTVNGTTITDYKTRGWAAMVNTFKYSLFPTDNTKQYYLSAAPQCVVPDEHLSTVIANSWFDFLFVQFYNTPQCSARAALSSSNFASYTNWVSAPSKNTDVKVYVGLAATGKSAADDSYYLEPSEVNTLVSEVYSEAKFGGIMLWEASTAEDNIICGKDYGTWMKQILDAQESGKAINTVSSPCPAQPISPDGSCGSYTGYTCAGSLFGNCCSAYGYCGNTAEYCAAATCDATSGDCGAQYVGTSNSTSNATVSVSGSYTNVTGSLDSASAAAVAAVAPAAASASGASSAQQSTSITTSASVAAAASASGVSSAQQSILMTTSISVATSSRTISTTNAAGQPTVYITEDITSYTTICPVTAAEASASAEAAALSAAEATATPSASVDVAAVNNSRLSASLTTSTVVSTNTHTVSTTDAAGQPTVYVTEDITSYTTVCPVTAAEASASAALAAQSAAEVAAVVAQTTVTASASLTTSTVVGTNTRTISTTDTAGQPTVYVTEEITSYTTVCPVTAAEASASYNAAAVTNNGVSASLTTSTVVSTNTHTVSTTDTAGQPTVYVTEEITSYTTICPVTAAEASAATSGPPSVYTTQNGDDQTSTKTSTTTIQSTSYVYQTVTVSSSTASVTAASSFSSSVPAVSPVATSASAPSSDAAGTIGASASSSVSSAANSASAPSSVSSAASSVSVPSSEAVGAIAAASSPAGSSSAPGAGSVGSYPYGNSSSIAYYPTAGTASSTVIAIVTATVAPVQAQVSQGFSMAVASGTANSTVSQSVIASSTAETGPIFTGAASRAEFGMGAIALAVGAFIAL